MRRNVQTIQLLLLISLSFACSEKEESQSFSTLERPQDAALVCYDSKGQETLPLSCCKSETVSDRIHCDGKQDGARLIAFVTQTIQGEVAVVDVDEQEVISEYPVNISSAFIPVGGFPNDIAATDDGSRVYTANRGSGDLSVIPTTLPDGGALIETPYLAPAATMDIGGSAARLKLVKQPAEYLDKVALVTQPELGRLAVVALDSENCAQPSKHKHGCLKGYLPFSDKESDIVVQPYALTDASGDILYVGSLNSSVIFSIPIGPLVEAALNMDEPDALPRDEFISEVIDISPHRMRHLSIEPKKRRWLYGITHDRGEVIAMNLADRAPGDPINPKTIRMDGIASAVKVLELSEDDEPGPLTFNGTFAVILSSSGHLTVVDIEDKNHGPLYFRPNAIRASVDMNTEEGIPAVESEPSLTVNNAGMPKWGVDDPTVYLDFAEEEVDGGVPCEDGADFRPTSEHGVTLRCNPYENSARSWTLEWQGPIVKNKTGVITNVISKEDEPWRLLNVNESEDFCASEIFPKDAFSGYPGDRLIITSVPSPNDGAEEICEELYGDDDPPQGLIYQIVAVSNYSEEDTNANVLEFVKLDEDTKDLLPECYGQALEFDIYASEHWTFQEGGTLQKGTYSPEDKTCIYDDTPSMFRVFPSTPFKRKEFTFNLQYGELWKDGPFEFEGVEVSSATYRFSIKNGYKKMQEKIGINLVTDIEVMPNQELLLVDQPGEGLIVFDMLNEFTSVGRHIF